MENNNTNQEQEQMFPAIPPNDYEGTISGWITALRERGYLKGRKQYFDVRIPESVYSEILK